MLLNNLFANCVCRDGITNKIDPRVLPVEIIPWKLQQMLSKLYFLISNYFRMSEFLALLR